MQEAKKYIIYILGIAIVIGVCFYLEYGDIVLHK